MSILKVFVSGLGSGFSENSEITPSDDSQRADWATEGDNNDR
jgi:hypothetical protein